MNLKISKTPLILGVLLLILFAAVLYELYTNTDKNGYRHSVDLVDGEIIELIHLPSEKIFTVEIASTAQSRAMGLMWREELDGIDGMIFVFPVEEMRIFWMSNTLISLDIIFLNADMEVINIERGTKVNQTEERYHSDLPSKFVLELPTYGNYTQEMHPGDKFLFIE